MNRLYTETHGNGEPLVMLHGWGMHTGIWRDFSRRLGRYYQVICVDLPGHGRSPGSDFSLESCTESLLDVLPQQPCCWLGWSLGALLALAVAEKAPQRVEALILLSGNPRFTRTKDWPGLPQATLRQFADNLEKDRQWTLIRFLFQQVQGLPDAAEKLQGMKNRLGESGIPDQQALFAGLRILRESDLRQTLQSLSCPALAILGGQDTLVPAAAGNAMRQLQPELVLKIIDDAGHVPFLSHEREVLQQIRQFRESS